MEKNQLIPMEKRVEKIFIFFQKRENPLGKRSKTCCSLTPIVKQVEPG